MNTIFSYIKGSYSFSTEEKLILLKLIDYFKHEIPNGDGAFISMLDLDKIDFRWCPAMKDTDVFGAWIILFKNTVFVRPIKELLIGNQDIQLFPTLNLNQSLLKYTLYMLEDNGMMLSTVFHELYHKWQYKTTGILYILNCLIFMLTGYEFSTKSKYSIEGDVRIHIDNEELHSTIRKFYDKFYKYLWMKNRMQQIAGEDYTTEIKEIEKDFFIMSVYSLLS